MEPARVRDELRTRAGRQLCGHVSVGRVEDKSGGVLAVRGPLRTRVGIAGNERVQQPAAQQRLPQFGHGSDLPFAHGPSVSSGPCMARLIDHTESFTVASTFMSGGRDWSPVAWSRRCSRGCERKSVRRRDARKVGRGQGHWQDGCGHRRRPGHRVRHRAGTAGSWRTGGDRRPRSGRSRRGNYRIELCRCAFGSSARRLRPDHSPRFWTWPGWTAAGASTC